MAGITQLRKIINEQTLYLRCVGLMTGSTEPGRHRGMQTGSPLVEPFVMTPETYIGLCFTKKIFRIGLVRRMAGSAHTRFHRLVGKPPFKLVFLVTAEAEDRRLGEEQLVDVLRMGVMAGYTHAGDHWRMHVRRGQKSSSVMTFETELGRLGCQHPVSGIRTMGVMAERTVASGHGGVNTLPGKHPLVMAVITEFRQFGFQEFSRL